MVARQAISCLHNGRHTQGFASSFHPLTYLLNDFTLWLSVPSIPRLSLMSTSRMSLSPYAQWNCLIDEWFINFVELHVDPIKKKKKNLGRVNDSLGRQIFVNFFFLMVSFYHVQLYIVISLFLHTQEKFATRKVDPYIPTNKVLLNLYMLWNELLT